MKTKLFLLVFLIQFLNSCSSTNTLTLSVTKPAPVFISNSINSVGIIDRSTASNENKVLDDLDKILSAEGKDFDKKAAQKMIVGLYDELSMIDKFSNVKVIEDTNLKNPGLGVFPSTISWNMIEQLCNDNNVDIIFALSFFDTDSQIRYKLDTVAVNNLLGISIPVLEHHATVTTSISNGWRIYDPINKFVLDEYLMSNSVKVEGKGINPVNAAKAIIGRKEAVYSLSNRMGHDYASRIFPYKIRVRRDYYVKGTNNFEIAMRRAQTGDWDGAAELWEKELNNTDPKIVGRACYNMAIINEINGNLEKAIEWASKSYADYNDKLALKYTRILNNRIEQNNILKNQN